jgi:hypothetical protein
MNAMFGATPALRFDEALIVLELRSKPDRIAPPKEALAVLGRSLC